MNPRLIYLIIGLVILAGLGFVGYNFRKNAATLTAQPTSPAITLSAPPPAIQTPIPAVVPVPTTVAAKKEILVNLAANKQASESGTASLFEINGQVVVTLTMVGAPATTSQPAHIHTGTCPTVGAVKYPLNNVVNGKSETTLKITLESLLSQLPLGINIHKSVPQASVYVACGDVKDN